MFGCKLLEELSEIDKAFDGDDKLQLLNRLVV